MPEARTYEAELNDVEDYFNIGLSPQVSDQVRKLSRANSQRMLA